VFVMLVCTTLWWSVNAPYCCVHICGCTSPLGGCWGNVVIPLLFVVFVFLVIATIASKHDLEEKI